jgi:ribonuclease R
MPKRPEQPSPRHWREAVRHYTATHADQPLKARALARTLGVPEADYKAFRELLREMVAAGGLVLGPGRTLRAAVPRDELVGQYRANERGFGFVLIPEQPDVFIPAHAANGALDGDTVSVRVSRRARGGDLQRGEVVRVVSRGAMPWVGRLSRGGAHWYVTPQAMRAAPLLRIDDPGAKGAAEGDLVVVEPIEYTLRTPHPRAVIIERLGPASDARNLVRATARRFGIPEAFPAAVRAAAQAAAEEAEDLSGAGRREDLRGLLTITIDPSDARDYDDAISVEALEDGRTRLGVHIADVAHFVPAGGALDDEALERGNSVYLPQYVVPMLPEVLSNGVCSLQPGVPRLTKSVFLTYDRRGRVVEERFANSVIESAARLDYVEASAALEGKTDGLAPEVVALLERAAELARRIHARRTAAGMLVLALPELQVRLDDAGQVVDAGPAETSFSHTIIEMCMVEANEAVSRCLTAAGEGHLRRVHPAPAAEGAAALQPLRPLLGDAVPRELSRAALTAALERVRGQPAENVVSYFLLRSLPQAAYSPAPDGHFALASEHYCHFTSPIRRYADLVNHRRLDALLRGEARPRGRKRAGDRATDQLNLSAVALHINGTERRAQQVEREARQALLLLWLADKVGEEFEGVVTGVAPPGVFVQLRPMLAEGLVRASDFGRGNWVYDGGRGVFTATSHDRVLHVGVALKVRIAGVDQVRQQLMLAPVDPATLGVAGGGLKRMRPNRAVARRARRRR